MKRYKVSLIFDLGLHIINEYIIYAFIESWLQIDTFLNKRIILVLILKHIDLQQRNEKNKDNNSNKNKLNWKWNIKKRFNLFFIFKDKHMWHKLRVSDKISNYRYYYYSRKFPSTIKVRKTKWYHFPNKFWIKLGWQHSVTNIIKYIKKNRPVFLWIMATLQWCQHLSNNCNRYQEISDWQSTHNLGEDS